MPCLSITNGPFLNAVTTWQSGNVSAPTMNGATVANAASGPNPGCSITKGSASEFIPMPPGGSVRFLIFGTPAHFVAVLTIQGGVGSVNRTVTIVDVSGTGPTLPLSTILFISAPSTSSLPDIDPSPGNGSVFLLRAPDGSGNVHASIHRSANGSVLCSAVPFTPSMQVTGNATATELQILEGAVERASCPRPAGEAQVTPDPLNFPDAVIGTGVAPALASSVRTATIRNDGDDCLTINSIGNVSPYSVVTTSPALPVTLDPANELDVEIRFAPTALGTFNVDLPITPTPAHGDTMIRCRGRARAPTVTLSFSGTVVFGAVPVASALARPLTIANTGERTINVVLAASPAGSEFAWPAFSGAIAPGASAPAITITFTPTAEGPVTRTLTFTSDAPSSPHSVTLSGEGCVARARIAPIVPPGPTVHFGAVQRGFRTVRVIRVQNTGNGPLSFRARTADSTLFAIQRDGGSITAPLTEETFEIAPPTRCGGGSTGPGEVTFAITFFADAAPGLQTARLILDNHNGEFSAPASYTYDLEAEVIAVINADVELVIDRSGSMNDSSGPRRKIDTALDAARLFVQLGRPDVDDRIGAVRFNTVPEQVQAMTAMTASNQAALVGTFVEANFTPSSGTAIAGGVIQAVRDLNASARAVSPPQLSKAVVVLTDANDNTPYVNPDDGHSYTLLAEGGHQAVTVPADVRLYGVGIGDAIDTGRLAQLCPTTGGQYLHVHDFAGLDYFKLEKHFTQIYMATVDLAQISDPTYLIHPLDTHEHRFDILRGDVTFMVVIFDRDEVRLPFWLVSPQNEILELTTIPSGFQIRPGATRTARFMEVRLPQGEPDRYAGEWRVVIKHDGKLCYAPGTTQALGWMAGAFNAGSHASHLSQDGRAFGFTSTKCKPNAVDPVMYGIALGAGSNFRMMPFVEPGIVSVGQPIRLNALVSEYSLPVRGCTVTVDAKAPDGTIRSMTLADDGAHQDGEADDGDYGGTFLQTHQEGMYELLFRARGTSRDGEPVMREATLSKYVQGREKLDNPNAGGGTTGGRDECCGKLERGMRTVSVLLALIFLALLWGALR